MTIMEKMEEIKSSTKQMVEDGKKIGMFSDVVVENMFDDHKTYRGAGWMARHDPEELDRRRGIEIDSEDKDWSINGN